METHQMKAATTRTDLRDKVFYFAVSSRLFVIFLSSISNILIPDHNAGVYLFPQPPVNKTMADEVIQFVFGGMARWDAQYFLHIAHFGYTYENTLAFFPLFPYFTKTFAHLLNILFQNSINVISSILISAIIVNFCFFVNASLKLFDLSCKILRDDSLAYKSALFFCLNPASIFFSAPYSESCYAFFTFSGMLFYSENNKDLISSLAFSLSCCARSNGILNFGYLVHKNLKKVFTNIQTRREKLHITILSLIFVQVGKLFIYAVVFFTPFVLFQGYIFMMFCSSEVAMPAFIKEYGQSNGFIMPSSKMSPWCKYTIPFSYSYVQNHYWDVGFLKYYKLKQIPNFILALPVILLILRFSYQFMLENKGALFSLGLSKSEHVRYKGKELGPEFFVFVVHALFLTIFCTLFVHIQVTTRMIASSSPVLYWLVVLQYKTETNVFNRVISSRLKANNSLKYSLVESQINMKSVWRTVLLTEKPSDMWSFLVRNYFFCYVIVGTFLFSNFLPWT